MKKTILPVLLASAWIGLSEFVRNQFLLAGFWKDHYSSMNITFPSEPINGAVWGIWSLMFAIFLFVIAKKFTLLQTTAIGWFAGFVLMWLTIGNLGVLPFGILIYAIPLSILEVFLAAFTIKKLAKDS